MFNRKALVREMVESIVSQSYPDWEMILVDDGSDDGTYEMLCAYAERDARIRTVRRNRGPKGAQTCRNIGFALSEGEFVVFFDSDDWVAEYCLAQRVAFMNAHPELDFAVFQAQTFSQRPGDGGTYMGIRLFGDDLARLVETNLPFIVWTNIYRKSSLVKSGIVWDERLLSLQDSDYNIQALLHGLKYRYADCPIDYHFRWVAGRDSISQKILTPAHYESHFYSLQKILSILPDDWQRRNRSVIHRRFVFLYRIFQKDESGVACRKLFEEARSVPGIYCRLKLHDVAYRFMVERLAWRRELAFKIAFLPFCVLAKVVYRMRRSRARKLRVC